MFCEHCGAKLKERQKFCTSCGEPTAAAPPESSSPRRSLDPANASPLPVMATASAPQPTPDGGWMAKMGRRKGWLIGCILAGIAGIAVVAVLGWVALNQLNLAGRDAGSGAAAGSQAGSADAGAAAAVGFDGGAGSEESEEGGNGFGASGAGSEAAQMADNQAAASTQDPQVEGGLGLNLFGNEPSPLPTSLREGLAGFDSYRVRMTSATRGPTADEYTNMETDIRWSQLEDARHIRVESEERTADSPEVLVTVQDQYQVGLDTCTVDYDDDEVYADLETMTPLERDLAEASAALFDISITPDQPTLIGEETVAGIPVRHYTFRVLGLGDYSGAEVQEAAGEYWVAQDGSYLVKYALSLEARTAPEGDSEAEAVSLALTYELLEINRPLAIEIPAACYEVSP